MPRTVNQTDTKKCEALIWTWFSSYFFFFFVLVSPFFFARSLETIN